MVTVSGSSNPSPPLEGTQNYIIHEPELGKGSFGIVYRVTCKTSKEVYAMKMIETANAEGKYKRHFEREIQINKMLPPHPNIVKYFSHWMEGTKLIILMELCAFGNIEDNFSKTEGFIPEPLVKQALYEILSGLAHLH